MCSAITSAVAVLFFVAPLAVEAQRAGRVHRIGFLGNSTAALEANLVGPFRAGLRELGYVEGKNIVIEQRLPVVPGHPEFVEAGGLMSFGPSYPGMHGRAAYFVDRILKGAKPADLPVERPTRFELVINLKAAKALGLKIPPSLLQRADKVIE